MNKISVGEDPATILKIIRVLFEIQKERADKKLKKKMATANSI